MSVRDPVRLMDVANVNQAYPRELLVDFTNGEFTILDNSGNQIKHGRPGKLTIVSGDTSILVQTDLTGNITVDMENMLSDAAPLANGTASAGTADKAARADHTHPQQTDISGNAETATKLAAPFTLALSGITATSANIDGSEDITISVTAIPASIITGLATVATSGSYNDLDDLPTLLQLGGSAGQAATATGTVGTATTAAHSDHTHPLQTSVSGNAGSADEFSEAKAVTLTGDVTGTASSTAGWSLETTLANSGVTAGSYGPDQASDTTLGFGDSVKVPKVTVDAKGRVTAAGITEFTLPATPTDVTGNAGTATKLAATKNISISGAATAGAVGFDGSNDVNLNVTSLDATKLSGLVPIESIPQGALERLVIVADQTAMLALTVNDVQNGDTVKLNNPGTMYYVKDQTKLGTIAAFEPYNAGAAASVDWANVQNKPTIPGAGNGTTAVSAGDTASDGTSTAWARSDHQHNLPDSGVTAGTYGSADGGTLDYGESFKTVLVTVDKKGRVTSAAEKTFTLPDQYSHPSHTAAASGLYKVTVDALGHVTAVDAVTKSDITALGIPAQDTQYTHPTYTVRDSGFYKITVDNTGHISAASYVTKKDITDLGIPAQDTVYEHDTFDSHAAGLYKITVNGEGHVTEATAVTKADITALGIPAQDTQYEHPTHTAHEAGLYKVTVDALGHVIGATAVAKSDITALGIPGEDTDTTYDADDSTITLTGTTFSQKSGIVTAGSAGPANNASPAHGAGFSVPYVTVDTYGRVTGLANKTITLPAQYSHPTHDAAEEGLYKVTVDELGHVIGATAVTKSDITALGIPAQDTQYTHPTHTAHAAGLYKVTVDELGHVTAATAVAKSDITALGIPAQDTVYTHDTFDSHEAGLYKVTVNGEGHVTAATAVTKADITALGIPAQDTEYTHPSHTAHAAGLYKVTVDDLGHVTAATAVAKSDITALGIPGEDTDTTYTADEATLTLSGTEFALKGGVITAGSAGPSSNVSPAAGTGFSVPYVTVDQYGRVTGLSTKTITLPATPTDITGNAGTATKLANTRNFSITGAATANAVAFDGSDDVVLEVSSLDASALTGTVPITTMPAGALERLLIVANQAAMLDLTDSQVQNGDTVKLNDSGLMYFVKDQTKLKTMAAFEPYTVGSATNAATADEFSSAQSVTLTGDVTGTASSTAGWSVATTLANSGVTAGSYGPAADASPDHEAGFSVPYVTVDAKGRVTAASTKTITLPAQYVHPTSYTAHDTGLYKISNDVSGHITGATAVVKADITALGIPAQDTTYDADEDTITLTGTTFSLVGGVVTAGSAGPASDASPAYGAGFSVPYVTVDEYGRVTGLANKTITLPASDNTDTKVIQTSSTSASAFPILGSAQASPTSGTAYQTIYNSSVTITPSTGKITATTFNGDHTGTLNGVAIPNNPKLTDTLYTADESTLTLSGTEFALKGGVITAGTAGPSAGSTLGYSGTFTVPYITFDEYGRVTAASTQTFTLPASDNVDTKVTQYNRDTYSDAYPLLAAGSTAPNGSATTSLYASTVTLTPNAGKITATTFDGDHIGTLNGTTIPANPKLTDTTYTNGTGLSLSGTEFSLATSGVTAGTYGVAQTADTTLSFGSTIRVPTITVDSYGRVTSANHFTLTLPSNPNTDKKVTQTAYSSSANLPLLTSTRTNPAGSALGTYYNTSVYLNHSTKMLTTVGLTVSTAGNVSGISKTYTATLPAGSSWSGSAAPYTYALSVSGITANDKPVIDITFSGTYATDKTRCDDWANVYRGVTSANVITFYAHAKPTSTIPLQIQVVR